MSDDLLRTPDWTYGIGFLPPVGVRSRPELVFKVQPDSAERLCAQIEASPLLEAYVPTEKYLGRPVPFWCPGDVNQAGPTLLESEPRFGFEGCGYVTEQDREVWFCFPLIASHVAEIALSIDALTTLLNHVIALEEKKAQRRDTNQRGQLIELEAFIRMGEHHLGHPLGGQVFPAFRRWLAQYAKQAPKVRGYMTTYAALPDSVTDALRFAWIALATSQYAEDCSALLYEDGRFVMTCFGNACDLAIYPDCDYGGEYPVPSRFSCHNLDQASQQLTLLSGLAALYEIMERDVEGK